MTGEIDYIVLKKISPRLCQLVVLAALIVLAGWVLDIGLLIRIFPDWVMNPTTATLFVLSGISLWWHNMTPQNQQIPALEVIVLLIIFSSGIRLFGFYHAFDIGIDQFLFRNQLDGSRMAPNTALNFLLYGLSLLLLRRTTRHHFLISQVAAIFVLVISLLAIIGYLYVDRVLYRVADYMPMSLTTAVSFLLLSMGILFASGQHGVMSVIMHKNIGGKISRILLPITILIPIILGWLNIVWHKKGLYTLEFGNAFLTIATIFIFTVLIWGLAWSINGTDEKRKRAEQDMLTARLEAEDAKKVQEQFLANMSHEIRTPINGVIGMTELIKDTKLDQEQREYFDIIEESASNLLVIINDILDIAKMKAGKIVFEEAAYSIDHITKSLVKLFSIKAVQKGIRLQYEIAPSVPDVLVGDATRLNQILINLINNAIKFTEKGEVTIRIRTLREDNDRVTVAFDVTDTGIGIAEDKLASIFESFTQASSAITRKYGGTGLGLTITRQLIQLQGGEISLVSQPGQGSTFSFYLPIKRQVAATAAPEIKLTQDEIKEKASNITILLAEDNIINQVVASKILAKQGMAVDIANNGKEVIDMLARKKYQLILMDVQMPEMDGLETTGHIRGSNTSFARIPIIALTASALTSERSKCFEAGMDDFISKPFKAEELYEKIRLWAQ